MQAIRKKTTSFSQLKKYEVASLTLQQAYSAQEMLNSKMAFTDSKLREIKESNEAQFRKDYPLSVGTDGEEQARLTWYSLHPFIARNEKLLCYEKKYLEELYVLLSDHIEELTLS